MEAHCITKIAIVVEQHIRQSACSFPRSQIVLLAAKTDLINLIVPLERPRRRRSGIHTMMVINQRSVYLFVQDYIEAREASGSVRTAGPKDLTVTKGETGTERKARCTHESKTAQN